MNSRAREFDRADDAAPAPFWRDAAIVVLAAIVAAFPALGTDHDLRAREIRHASIAREMVVTGEFLVPHRLGAIYYDKPPVMHAMIAAWMIATGDDSLFAVRLPSAIASIVGALATLVWGRIVAGRRAGFWGAIMLTGTIGWIQMARMARPDMVFTAAIWTACAAAAAAVFSSSRGRSLILAFVGGLSAGIAVLTKGPYGWILPIFATAATLYQHRDRRRPSAGAIALFFFASLIVPGAWALRVSLEDGGAYVRGVLTQPDLTSGAAGHSKPFYWYFPALWSFLPWTIALVGAASALRRRRDAAFLAAAAFFVLLSCIPGKRVFYLLPWYPAAAIAVARWTTDDLGRRWGRAVRILALTAPILIGAAFVFDAARKDVDPDLALAAEIVDRLPKDAVLWAYGEGGDPVYYVGARAGILAPGDVREPIDLDSLKSGAEETLAAGKRSFILVRSTELERTTAVFVGYRFKDILIGDPKKKGRTLIEVEKNPAVSRPSPK